MFDHMSEKEMGFDQNIGLEQDRREKGKEAVIFQENPNDLVNHQFDRANNMLLVDQQTTQNEIFESQLFTGDKDKEEEEEERENGTTMSSDHQQTSKLIEPCFVLVSDQRPRLRWTLDLHTCFVNAVMKLGGPHKATPKSVLELMGVDGVALHHVKSHLQKFRLGKCNLRQQMKCTSASECVAGSCASACLPTSQVKMTRAAQALRPKRPKEIQGSLYMRMEAGLHLRRCLEAQRMYLDLALESAQRKHLESQNIGTSSSSPSNNLRQDLTALPPPPPSAVAPCGDPLVQHTHQTMNPCDDHAMYGSGPYTSYCNTLETVEGQLGSTSQYSSAAASQTVDGGLAMPAIEVPEVMGGDHGAGGVAAEVREATVDDPVDAFIDWDKVEDEFPNDEFLFEFFNLFGFDGQF